VLVVREQSWLFRTVSRSEPRPGRRPISNYLAIDFYPFDNPEPVLFLVAWPGLLSHRLKALMRAPEAEDRHRHLIDQALAPN
jgi:hypothetical protein